MIFIQTVNVYLLLGTIICASMRLQFVNLDFKATLQRYCMTCAAAATHTHRCIPAGNEKTHQREKTEHENRSVS